MDAVTHHTITTPTPDTMELCDTATKVVLVTATRTPTNKWLVHAVPEHTKGDRVDDLPFEDRGAAIMAMTEHAYRSLGPVDAQGHGYSTTVPHGLYDQP